MSNLVEALMSQLGDNEVNQISSQLGVSSGQTQNAMASAIPILMNALAKNSSSSKGAQSLENALQKHDGSILDNLGGFLNKPDLKDGAGILKHVLGSKRQNVERYVSDDAGMSGAATGKMLEMLAPVVLGYLGKQKRGGGSSAGGGVGDLLGSFLNQEKSASPKSQSVIEQLLDQDNDGSIADDVAELGASLLGRFLRR